MKLLFPMLSVVLLSATPAAPVRHLEYVFAMYPTDQGARPGYYDGTLSVDILGPSSDGGVSVSMTESWYHAPRPEQPRVCELYADGGVRCEDGPPYPTEVQEVLLPLLGRDFFDSASARDPSKWQQKFTLSFRKATYPVAASMDLKTAPQRDGRLLAGTMSGAYNQLNSTGVKVIVDARFVYDSVSRVPVVVHDNRMQVPGGIDGRYSADLQLTKDSAADALDAAALQQLGPIRFEISDFADEGDF